jgi:hypothetical protein
VHGIGTYRYYRQTGSAKDAAHAIATDWFRHLGTAMPPASSVDLSVAYYGQHVNPGFADDLAMLGSRERAILADWVAQFGPDLDPMEAAEWLARTYGPATRLFGLAFAREVHTYFSDPQCREAARIAVAKAIVGRRPDVLVAHSLGSVVAYETLWAHQDCDVPLLVTLGSPLAMPGIVRNRLEHGEAARPPRVRRWVNLADVADIVALPSSGLGARFDGVERDIPIAAGMWEFHTPGAYLRSTDVTRVIFDETPAVESNP